MNPSSQRVLGIVKRDTAPNQNSNSYYRSFTFCYGKKQRVQEPTMVCLLLLPLLLLLILLLLLLLLLPPVSCLLAPVSCLLPAPYYLRPTTYQLPPAAFLLLPTTAVVAVTVTAAAASAATAIAAGILPLSHYDTDDVRTAYNMDIVYIYINSVPNLSSVFRTATEHLRSRHLKATRSPRYD